MPKTIAETAILLDDYLQKSGKDVIKMQWSQFYEIGGLKALKTTRWDRLVDEALYERQLILGWGEHYVLLARDEEHYLP